MKSILYIPLVILFSFASQAEASSHQPIASHQLIVDLSKSVVAITAGFAGSDLLLFGATKGSGDIIVVVRGPKTDTTVRRKERIFGIWINRDEFLFSAVPSFYHFAASRPLDEILNPALQSEHKIGPDNLHIMPIGTIADMEELAEFRSGFIRNKQNQGLYSRQAGKVTFPSDLHRLFRTRLHFPSNVPIGKYQIDVYLIEDQAITDIQSTNLFVKKVGIEAEVYNFANNNSIAYGILAIVIAVMAGWLASVVFKKA